MQGTDKNFGTSTRKKSGKIRDHMYMYYWNVYGNGFHLNIRAVIYSLEHIQINAIANASSILQLSVDQQK